MTPLRIIMLSYERGFLDPASESSRRLSSQASNDIRITSVLLANAYEKGQREDGSVRVIGFDGVAPVRVFRSFFAAVRAVRRARKEGERPLISAQDPFAAGIVAFWISRFLDVPYEVQEHADYFSGEWERERPLWNRILALKGRFILRRADSVRAVSERVRDHLVNRYGVSPDRIRVIPVAQDVSAFIQSRSPDTQSPIPNPHRPFPQIPTIVAPCRFVKQKGLDVLIHAFAQLQTEKVAFRARLVGAGPLRRHVAEQIERLGLKDCVTIEPWATQDAEWDGADLFVLSSRYEGWGRTIVEAMAARVPIVTTDVGCVGSFLRPQIDGRVVPVNDVEALASAIREQITEPERRAWMVEQAFERSKTFPEKQELVTRQRTSWEGIAAHPSSGIWTGRRAWMLTAGLVVFAILVRSVSMALFWKTLGANREWGFFTLVQNWFLGNGYSFVSAPGCVSAYRSPGFLFFLTAVYGLFGFANFFAQALIQNILAVIVVYLVYRLGWRITDDRRVGLIAGLVISLHPYTLYNYTQYYHTVLSSLFLVGLLLSVLALERTKDVVVPRQSRPPWRWAVMSGVLIACLAYIQGTILPATAFLSLWLLIRWWPDWKKAVGAVMVMAVVSAALIAPWTYRNWEAFHAFVPLTTDLGHALAKANNDHAYRWAELGYPQEAFDEMPVPGKPLTVRYSPLPEVTADFAAHGWTVPAGFFFGEEHPLEPGLRQTCEDQRAMTEVQFNAYWMDQGTTWLKQHYWTEGVKLEIQKMTQFWSPVLQPAKKYGAAWSFGNTGVIATLVQWSLAGYVALLEILALIGIALASKKKGMLGRVAPLLIVFAVYTLMHSFFAGYTKYRIPLDNLLAVLAAITVAACWNNVGKKRR
jgi:glycosyltransferase involved in cell wall biosynthesis/4-amino-4-deoxy-L-arabinose transferase-like glycosyltransferase